MPCLFHLDTKDQMTEEGWSDGRCGCPQVRRGKRPDGASFHGLPSTRTWPTEVWCSENLTGLK